jgi:hypothetical protein
MDFRGTEPITSVICINDAALYAVLFITTILMKKQGKG